MLRTLAILSGAGSEWTVSPFRSQCAGSYFQSSRPASCGSSSERGRQWRDGTPKVSRKLRPHFMHLVASGSICGNTLGSSNSRPSLSSRTGRHPRFDHLVKRVAIRFGFVVYDLQLPVEIDFRNDSFFLIFDDAAPPCDKDFLPRFQFVGPPATCPEGFRRLEKARRIRRQK